MEIKGSTFDWEGFEIAKKVRWVRLDGNIYFCKEHKTQFDPIGNKYCDFQDSEPCWKCYQEFEIEL